MELQTTAEKTNSSLENDFPLSRPVAPDSQEFCEGSPLGSSQAFESSLEGIARATMVNMNFEPEDSEEAGSSQPEEAEILTGEHLAPPHPIDEVRRRAALHRFVPSHHSTCYSKCLT